MTNDDEFHITIPTGILTVGYLRGLLDGREDQEQVVMSDGDWFVNVGGIALPHWNGDDNESDWSCFTMFPGSEFDSRQL